MQSENGCIDYDKVIVTVDNSRNCNPTCRQADLINETVNRTRVITGADLVVAGILRVGAKGELKIENSKLSFKENAMIEVMPGGKLIISDSEFRGCGDAEKWKGIVIKGRKNERSNFRIERSVFSDATTAIKAEEVFELNIIDNKFFEGGTAIEMVNSNIFNISENKFYSNSSAIRTRGSQNMGRPSSITGNFFSENITAVEFNNDNHSGLMINCNSFVNYSEYGILSRNTTLADQGNNVEGAGNYFISSASRTNHQFNHSGNNMKYYVDPAAPFSLLLSGGTTASTFVSENDGSCFAHEESIAINQSAGMISNSGAGSLLMSASENFLSDLILEAIPNPASDRLNIIFNPFDLPQNTQLLIFNMYGQVLERQNITNHQNSIEFDISKYSSGMYYYGLISQGKFIGIKKLIIAK
jgi:hypothetical protein